LETHVCCNPMHMGSKNMRACKNIETSRRGSRRYAKEERVRRVPFMPPCRLEKQNA
jgi:hypothetical protein